MRAITLWRPWPHLIFMGWKTIETRKHDAFAWIKGHTIAIHAGKAWDDDAEFAVRPYLTLDQEDELDIGVGVYDEGVIGVVTVEDARCLTDEDSPRALCRADGLFGLVMIRMMRLARPVPCRGKQGIWTLQPLVEAAVRSQLAA